jgi:hypothetical protein
VKRVVAAWTNTSSRFGAQDATARLDVSSPPSGYYSLHPPFQAFWQRWSSARLRRCRVGLPLEPRLLARHDGGLEILS